MLTALFSLVLLLHYSKERTNQNSSKTTSLKTTNYNSMSVYSKKAFIDHSGDKQSYDLHNTLHNTLDIENDPLLLKHQQDYIANRISQDAKGASEENIMDAESGLLRPMENLKISENAGNNKKNDVIGVMLNGRIGTPVVMLKDSADDIDTNKDDHVVKSGQGGKTVSVIDSRINTQSYQIIGTENIPNIPIKGLWDRQRGTMETLVLNETRRLDTNRTNDIKTLNNMKDDGVRTRNAVWDVKDKRMRNMRKYGGRNMDQVKNGEARNMGNVRNEEARNVDNEENEEARNINNVRNEGARNMDNVRNEEAKNVYSVRNEEARNMDNVRNEEGRNINNVRNDVARNMDNVGKEETRNMNNTTNDVDRNMDNVRNEKARNMNNVRNDVARNIDNVTNEEATNMGIARNGVAMKMNNIRIETLRNMNNAIEIVTIKTTTTIGDTSILTNHMPDDIRARNNRWHTETSKPTNDMPDDITARNNRWRTETSKLPNHIPDDITARKNRWHANKLTNHMPYDIRARSNRWFTKRKNKNTGKTFKMVDISKNDTVKNTWDNQNMTIYNGKNVKQSPILQYFGNNYQTIKTRVNNRSRTLVMPKVMSKYWERVDYIEKQLEEYRKENNLDLNELKLSEAKMFNKSQIKVQQVVLYGSFRTGSTYSSLFLSKHNDFYNIYEPIKLITKSKEDNGSPIEKVKCIEKTLNCEFSDLWQKTLHNTYLVNSSLMGWRRRIFCLKYAKDDVCQALPIDLCEQRCRTYKHIVTKVIQLKSITNIEYLLRKGYSVVYLVRDPRGMLSSVMALYARDPAKTLENLKHKSFYKKVMVYIFKYCAILRADLYYLQKKRESYKNRSFIIVRYEDFAHTPYHSMTQLYTFLNVKPDDKLTKWVKKQDDVALNRPGVKMEEHVDERTYNTQRKNSSKTAFRWKGHFPFHLVKDIENVCEDIMKVYNYSTVDADWQLRDDSITFLQPFSYENLAQRFSLKPSNMTLASGMPKGYYMIANNRNQNFTT